MSIMTRGIIGQPYNLAMHSGLSRRQFYSHAQVLLADHDSARKHWQNESNNVQALVAEVGRLKAENEALREVMSCVVNEIPGHSNRNGNAPGHCHAIPGVWDRGNGAKTGTECGWCKVWNAAVAMSKESSHD